MSNITRRRLLQLAGTSVICPLNSASAHPNGYTDQLPAVVDASENLTRAAVTLKQRGVKVVIRYYALENNLPEKIITKSEADALLQAGLSLAISYQYHNDDISIFTPERATRDAAKCLELANVIGQPPGTAIYFGVDGDWIDDNETKAIASYFDTLKHHDGLKKRGLGIGAYGSGFTCDWLRSGNLAEFFWIAGLSDGWSDRAKFMRSQHWNLYQNALEVAAETDQPKPKRIDTNIVNPNLATIGSFSLAKVGDHAGKPVADGAIDNEVPLKMHRVIDSDTKLFKNSDGTGELPTKVAESKIVSIVQAGEKFSLIDVPRQIKVDGIDVADFVRGYCRTKSLVKIEAFKN